VVFSVEEKQKRKTGRRRYLRNRRTGAGTRQSNERLTKETDGCSLGEEAWKDPKTRRIANVYYRNSERRLKQLIERPGHREAKRRYGEWLSGYQAAIAQVIRACGDKTIDHPTARA
jgi:hypothetical protein